LHGLPPSCGEKGGESGGVARAAICRWRPGGDWQESGAREGERIKVAVLVIAAPEPPAVIETHEFVVMDGEILIAIVAARLAALPKIVRFRRSLRWILADTAG